MLSRVHRVVGELVRGIGLKPRLDIRHQTFIIRGIDVQRRAVDVLANFALLAVGGIVDLAVCNAEQCDRFLFGPIMGLGLLTGKKLANRQKFGPFIARPGCELEILTRDRILDNLLQQIEDNVQ